MNIEEQLQQLQKRNEERVKEVIAKLGTKYLCHPANRVKKVERKQSTLKGTT